ncbi:MAG: TPM domain-containing protein [Cyclobacteriaceae bacterium]|nr:TPM domain-containing protein [Cyclobacteriaceae bacterium]
MKINLTPLLFIFLIIAVACGTRENRKASVFIRDSVQVLTQRQSDDLAKQIKSLEDSTGSQIGIVIIKTLHDEPIEQYSLRLANGIGLGRKDFDDGVLITVVVEDHQMRIEVGIGLENIIQDEIAAEIIRDDMAPDFRKAKYFEGLSKAVQRISDLIKNNRDKIGQRPQGDVPEMPTIDGYLVDEITDTAVQELSGSLALIVQPSDKQISEMEKEYSEDELSTIFDDASFYQSEAAHLLDSLGVKNVTSEKRFVRYRNIIREWNFDLEKQNSPWVLIFLEVDRKPEVILTTDVDVEKIKSYFNQ